MIKTYSLIAITTASLFAIVLTSCSGNTKRYEPMVLSMCKYIPDDGMSNTEDCLTDIYYNVCAQAFDAPCYSAGYIGEEDFLHYFVSAQDGEPIFTVKSIRQKKDSLIAEIYLQHGYHGVPFEFEEKRVCTMRLVKDYRYEGDDKHYLLDDWDNTKQKCIDYIILRREQYASGKFEKEIREDGGSSWDVRRFQQRVNQFYRKYGKTFNPYHEESSTGKIKENNNTSSATNEDSIRKSVEGKSFSCMKNYDNSSYLMEYIFSANGTGSKSFYRVEPYGKSLISSYETTWRIENGNIRVYDGSDYDIFTVEKGLFSFGLRNGNDYYD